MNETDREPKKEKMNSIILFESKQVRRVWNQDDQKWYFSVQDVLAILTESRDVKQYIKKMRSRDPELNANWGTFCTLVQMTAADGKNRKVQAANAEGLFRIIQSVPTPKAEPFKRWLAKVGYERLEEIENPELAAERMRSLYKAKGYSQDWIEKRVRGIAVRDELTEEWQQRGINQSKEFAILTAEISKATFGMTPSQYKQFKNLTKSNENLRDHMTDLELIFTMLGEASTTEIARMKDAQGFDENRQAAQEGGGVAGKARRDLENKSGSRVSTNQNFKEITQNTRKSLSNKKEDQTNKEK